MSLVAYYQLCSKAASLRSEAVTEPQTERRTQLHQQADKCLREAASLPVAALCCAGTGSASSGTQNASRGRSGARGRP
jgi:hypothetical protein